MSAQEKQMEVCEVCGAFLIIGDAQTRVDDHLQGKQHMGYAKIKSTIEELKVMKAVTVQQRTDREGRMKLNFYNSKQRFTCLQLVVKCL